MITLKYIKYKVDLIFALFLTKPIESSISFREKTPLGITFKKILSSCNKRRFLRMYNLIYQRSMAELSGILFEMKGEVKWHYNEETYTSIGENSFSQEVVSEIEGITICMSKEETQTDTEKIINFSVYLAREGKSFCECQVDVYSLDELGIAFEKEKDFSFCSDEDKDQFNFDGIMESFDFISERCRQCSD